MNILHIVSILCFAFCLVIFFYLKWYVKKRTSSKSVLDEYSVEVGKLVAEIDSAADRDTLLIEARIKKLKIILDETDKRILLYQKELEEINEMRSAPGAAKEAGNVNLYTSLGKGIKAALSTDSFNAPVLPAEAAQLKQRTQSAAQQVQRIQEAAQTVSAETVKKNPTKKQIRSHIDLLLNEGKTAEQIASELDISIAEVNLAMNLRRVKK